MSRLTRWGRDGRMTALTPVRSALWCRTGASLSGSYGGLSMSATIAERFWAKVDLAGPNGCWLWTAGKDSHGYGVFQVGSLTDGTRRSERAHRWAYEALVDPIPDGLQLDHLCRTPGCVNPDHLEAVTNKENQRRGLRGILYTHCKHGHEMTALNTYHRREGWRGCLVCRATANHRGYVKRKEARA